MNRDETIARKFTRLRAGGPPRVLDLFSGCGGFSLGFQRAGCEILGGIEIDPDAARSHALNFHRTLEGTPEFEVFARPRDITRQDPRQVVREFAPDLVPEEAVDLLIGGPPCPAFTRVGRAKLREIHQHPEAFLHDPRAQLYVPYLAWVKALSPAGLVMENVPDILNFGGHNLAEEICEVLEDLGYDCAYTLLNAANYGVPEFRQRFVLVAWHRVTGLKPEFPDATHHIVLPGGYTGAADVALKPLRLRGSLPSRWRPGPGQEHLNAEHHAAVTAAEALGDLPAILGHLDGTIGRGRRDLTAGLARGTGRPSTWVREHMLNWPEFETESSKLVTAHVIRALSHRDYRIFRSMKADDQYPEAYAVALEAFEVWLGAAADAGVPVGQPSAQDRLLAEDLVRFAQEFEQSEQLVPEGILPSWINLEERLTALGRRRLAALQAMPSRTDLGWPLPDHLQHDLGAPLATIRRSLVALVDANVPMPNGLDLGALAQKVRRLLAARDAWQASLKALGETDRPTDWAYLPEAAGVLDQVAGIEADLLAPPGSVRQRAIGQAVSVQVLAVLASLDLFLRAKACFVPPYDPMKFPNKWRKMNAQAPARTLMAHLGKDSYSHIHYDSVQARTISVREAARLQSFPDGFRFSGSMNPGFRQVGNAVPPMMSFAIGQSLCEQLQTAAEPSLSEASRRQVATATQLQFTLVR